MSKLIKGAKYTWGGNWFTFIKPHSTCSRYGIFRGESGRIRSIRLDVFETLPAAKPTPFPEPERWEQHPDWIHYVKFSAKAPRAMGFCAASEIASASAVKQHNAEIDRLMDEIRRLEALVNKPNN
jgi:hypothetical protein